MLVDVMMPGIDGFTLAQMLRGDRETSLTPIIFLSARGQTADKVRAFKLGAEDYLVKPFDAAELVARVEKALARRDELGASPTTQLPGSQAIEAEIDRRLVARGGDFAFCYLDLDNLKAFNDYYGYAKADGVIRQTGDIVREVVARVGGARRLHRPHRRRRLRLRHHARARRPGVLHGDRDLRSPDPALLQQDRSRARLHRDQRSLRRAAPLPDHERLDRLRHPRRAQHRAATPSCRRRRPSSSSGPRRSSAPPTCATATSSSRPPPCRLAS